jgi:hypothetical protein
VPLSDQRRSPAFVGVPFLGVTLQPPLSPIMGFPLGCWKVSFSTSTSSDVGKFQDGVLVLWKNNWLVLLNPREVPVIGRYLKMGRLSLLVPL